MRYWSHESLYDKDQVHLFDIEGCTLRFSNTDKETDMVRVDTQSLVRGNVSFRTLPGQCSTMIAHDFVVTDGAVLPSMVEVLQKLASLGGYTKTMVSFVVNSPICSFFEKNGYRVISEFVNKRTGHPIKILETDVVLD